MKWIDNLIYTLLSACLLAGCEDSGSKELERMHIPDIPHHLGNLIQMSTVRTRPTPPLITINMPQIPFFIRPFIPNPHTVFLQIMHVRISLQKP